MKLTRKYDVETQKYLLTFEITNEDLMLADMLDLWRIVWGKTNQRRSDYMTMLEELIRHPTQAGRRTTTAEDVAAAFRAKMGQSGSSYFGGTSSSWAHEPLGRAPTPDPEWCKVLGLPKTATKDQIKAKYRQLAKTHHPDAGGDPKQFDKINKAFKEAIA